MLSVAGAVRAPSPALVTAGNLAALDGPANFRDLGGFPTSSGGRIRHRRLFRSDSLSYLSQRDVAALRDDLGVRTVIDLRAGHEVEQFGHGHLAAHVRQLHLPIVDETREPVNRESRPEPRREPRPMSIGDIYTFMLREYAERFGAVLRVIADPAAHPLVFHCAAGKDRTGLVAMLVLELCGVPDETVVADFAFTESRMPEVIARHTARAASDEAVEVAAQQFGAEAVTMQAVLATLREHHGSVESYVRSTGVDDDEIDALRTALVEETSGWSRPRPE